MERHNLKSAIASDEAITTGGETPADDGRLEVENVPALSTLLVPSELLGAALACTSSDDPRFYLRGVYVHRVKERARIVGTDGHRLVVAEFDLDKDAPTWLQDGVIIPNDLLKAQLSFIGKAGESPFVKVSYAVAAPKIEIDDLYGHVIYRVAPVNGTYPDYQKIINGNVGNFDAGERGDFQPIAFNGAYLKACGDVAKILEADAVNVYAGKATDAAVLTFTNAPNVILYLMPMRGEEKLSATTAALLSPAIKATLAALRAHKTRNEQDAKRAKTKGERDLLQQRADEFAARIKAVVERTNPPALPKPAEAPGHVTFSRESPATEEKTTEAPASPTPAEPKIAITEAGRKAIEKIEASKKTIDANERPSKRRRDSRANNASPKKAKVRSTKATGGRKAKARKAKAIGTTKHHKKDNGANPVSVAA